MIVEGVSLIGGKAVKGSGAPFRALDPREQVEIDPVFSDAAVQDVSNACALAEAAFEVYAASSSSARSGFLETIARNLEHRSESIVQRAMLETGLPEARLRGELTRTTTQLRLFARVVRDEAYLDIRIDHAQPERSPPRPDIRQIYQPIGPVAVFGASNFPLAFSVAGGDTASALAAGCPVVVKAHPAHPGASELAGKAVADAVAECGLHPGVFAVLLDHGHAVGQALVADPRIAAVGFTGSRRGGLALMAIAQARLQPIPVFAEMSAINPVILLPGAVRERGEAIGRAFIAALNLGAGQFCTNPGLILTLGAGEEFLTGVHAAIADATPGFMLTPGIHAAYEVGVDALARHPGVRRIAQGPTMEGLVSRTTVFATTGADLRADPHLTQEVFGACSLLAICDDQADLEATLDSLEGQLTVAIHAEASDLDLARALLPRLQRLAGRVLFNGFGTGVEVCDAMVHGGPFPATSDGRSTSVGSLAINRFLRPVCYQDFPDALLPLALRDRPAAAVGR